MQNIKSLWNPNNSLIISWVFSHQEMIFASLKINKNKPRSYLYLLKKQNCQLHFKGVLNLQELRDFGVLF